MNQFTLMRKNLFRKKLRTGLMMLSILVAFAIFGVLTAFDRAFNAPEELAAADRLVVANKINYTQPLPISYVSQIRNIEGVQVATHANWFGGYFRDPRNTTTVLAVDPDTYMQIYDEDFVFPPDMRRSFSNDRAGALVGESLARKWGWKVGDRIPISSNIFQQKGGGQSWDVTIEGIFQSRKAHVGADFMLIQYEYLDNTRTFMKDLVGWIVLRTNSQTQNERISQTIDTLFANSAYETSTETASAFNKAFAAQLGNIALIVQLVVGAALVTILMIVGNMMSLVARERASEIAVLKTLGFSGAQVLRLILGESVLLSLLGGLAGLGVATVLTHGLHESLASFVPGISMTPGIAGTAVALMVGLGVATGIIPAINVFRLKISTVFERG